MLASILLRGNDKTVYFPNFFSGANSEAANEWLRPLAFT